MPYDYLPVVNARASRFDGYAVNNKCIPHKNTNALLVLLGAKNNQTNSYYTFMSRTQNDVSIVNLLANATDQLDFFCNKIANIWAIY